eukprot:765456-Hanusia_phi.AAC.9
MAAAYLTFTPFLSVQSWYRGFRSAHPTDSIELETGCADVSEGTLNFSTCNNDGGVHSPTN